METELKELLQECAAQVGMDLGEKIEAYIAKKEGKKFNPEEYNYEKPVGEQ